MDKDQIKKSIDSVSPDNLLKTRLKEKVLTTGHKPKKSKKKYIISAVSAVLCAVVIAVCLTRFYSGPGITNTNNGTTELETSKSAASGTITVYAAIGNEKEELQSGVQTPLLYNIAAVDLRGLDDKSIDKKIEDTNSAQTKAVLNTNKNYEASIRQDSKFVESTYFHIIQLNNFIIEPSSEKEVESIQLQCGKYGQLNYWDCRENVELKNRFPKGNDLTISGNIYYEIIKESSGNPLQIGWDPSEEMYQEISDNPNSTVSDYTDTLLFTVNYTDGTKEHCAIDLSFDENGTMIAEYAE